jgi:hypothetical protein
MVVEESKILVRCLYEEARNRGTFSVTGELKVYCWAREQVQRGLSTTQATQAERLLSPLRLRHGGNIFTWPRLIKPWYRKANFRTVRLTRRVLRAAIAGREERARWSKLLKELMEVGDVLRALDAFEPVANRTLRRKRYGRNRSKGVAALLDREWQALAGPALIAPKGVGSSKRPVFGQTWKSFTGPTDALPIDLFRVLVGLLSCAYFSRTFLEVPTFSSPHGLIDHVLVRRTLWYTRLGLFHPGVGPTFFRVLYPLAALGSLLLAAGIGVKPVSAFLYVTAVSTYRWNFLVTYVDDTVMHLMLLWMLLLPIGSTLALPEWLSERGAALERWKQAQVPGAAVRCLLANLALVYVVASLWKWTSPLWRQGLAVYAVLKTAVSRTPDRWRSEYLPALRVANHSALVLEPLFPVAFVLPSNHPLKWLIGVMMVGFHAGIIVTMKIPFANIACIAASVFAFRSEIMAWLRRHPADLPHDKGAAVAFDLSAKLASLLVAWLALAMLSEAVHPYWRYGTHPAVRANQQLANRIPSVGQNPFHGVLWFAGLAQSYRLFDWIDEKNYYITYEVVEQREDGTASRLDDEILFPRTLRSVLLQSYLHDILWMKVPRHRLAELQRSLFERYARRFCWQCRDSGRVEVIANVQRTTADNLNLDRPQRVRFLAFTCRDGEPRLHFMRLTRG